MILSQRTLNLTVQILGERKKSQLTKSTISHVKVKLMRRTSVLETMHKKRLLLLFFFLVAIQNSYSQCLQVLDGNGVFTDMPQFVSCTPGNYTVFIQPDRDMGNYTIVWGDGTPNSTGASLLTTGSEMHTYPGTTANYTITITDNSTGCTIMGMVALERNPLASIQLPTGDDNFGCTPVQFRFINSSTQVSSNTTFTWNFGDGSPTETYDFNNLGDTVLHTYLPGVGVQSCELNVTLTATNFCGSSTASFFPLRVWDLDEAQITPSATLLCYPDTIVQYTNSTIRNCFPEGNQSQRFERWNFGDYWGLGRDSIIEWRPWNPPIIAPPPIGYPGVGTYFVTLQDSSFCGIDDVTISIQITDPPVAVLTSTKDTICQGESVTFINSSTGGANSFRWNYDMGAGFENGGGGNKTRTYNASGDYTIRLAVRINGAQSCNDTADVALHVLPSPSADFTFDNNDLCDSMDVTFTNTSLGAISSYNWNFGNGNTFNGSNPPIQSYNSPMTYSASLTVANARGCSDTETKQLRVRETPVANFTVNSVCLNIPATFTDLSTSGGDPITSYNWDFGDGATSTQQNPTHLYTSFGTYTVRQIVSNGFCSDTAQLMVTVENRPTAAFVSNPDNGCSRLTVNFTNQSSANATSFRWNFGDGSSPVFARDTFHTYTNSGDFDTSFVVQMIAFTAFGCSDTTLDTINVFPIPTPAFTSDAVADCGPVTVNFTNTTVGDSLDFFWNFGDGSAVVNDTNPTHVFENKTLFINNYNVRLIVASRNGCRDTTIQTIQIYPEPIFTFASVPDSGCSPLSVSFPSIVGAVDYQWDFGDGSTGSGPTPTHLYINNTTNNQLYSIRLIAQNSFGCSDTTFGTVLVFPNPTSSFSLDTTIGCQPLPIEITNNSTGSNQFSWDFGDGTTSTNSNSTFTKTYTNTSAVARFNEIRLIVETVSGCRDTSSSIVEVYPFIQAAFDSDSLGCSPLPVSFVNQSFGAARYRWSFGDNGTDSVINPNHIYTNTTNSNQTYLSKLIAVSAEGCIDSAEKNITVYPKPTAVYTLSTNEGCQPLEVTFTNASILADSCVWNYGDLDSLKLCTPSNTHIYTNTTSFFPIDYTSELFVFTDEGCSDTLSLDIKVNPEVIADFASIDSGCSPLNVRFQNQSFGANSYDWRFGDGATSASLSPTHLYVNTTFIDQVNNLKLIATSSYGCVDSTTKDITVFAKPDAQLTVDIDSGCHPLEVNFTNSSVISDSCRWLFGDGTPVLDTCFIGQMRSHVYTNVASSFPVNRIAQLFVFTNNGCSDTTNQNILINPEITADISSIDSGCSPLDVRFQNQSFGAQSYDWRFGDGATSTSLSPNHIYTNTTFVDQINSLTLIATSLYGCTDTIRKDIKVFAKPDAQLTVDVDSGCHPLEVNFTNSSIISDSCRWNFGDGSVILDSCLLGQTRRHIYENKISSIPINRTARLFVYTNNGCLDTIDQNITINPEVIAAFSSPTQGCNPLAVNFTNQSTGATNFQWTYGDGGSDMIRNPSHLYLNLGQNDANFTTRLVATNNFGCSSDSEIVITVYPKPTADYTINVNDGCQPVDVQFTNNSNLATVCNWNYGDGNLNLNDCTPVTNHTYFNTQSLVPVTYTSELIVSTNNGCSDTLTRNISVRPQVIAAFTTDADSCAPVDATFRSQSSGAFAFEWDFDDNTMGTGAVVAHQFTNIGSIDSIYNVRLIAKSAFNCNDTAYQNVVVHPTPIVDFTATPLTQEFPDATVTLTNNTNNGNWSYFWDYGDQDTSILRNPGSHTYTTWGMYTINLTASSPFCEASKDVLVTIEAPTPVANFGDSAVGCEPLEVTFKNKSLYGLTYEWEFGDGGRSNSENPTHIYFNEGVYTVSLKVTGFPPGKTDAITKTNYIVVNKTPQANFIMNTTQVYIPNDPVVFSNRTVDADSYSWNFGDGNTSNEQSPTYQYTTEGEFSVLLIATTDQGCIDSARSPTNVIAELEGRVRVPNAFTPNPNGSNGGVVNINPGAGEFNDVFYAKVNGSGKYELNIFNKWGELIFVSKDINIGWDGYYKGQLVQQDVYVWKISVEFIDGTSLVKVGDLMLLR